jgi:hypothetical protein
MNYDIRIDPHLIRAAGGSVRHALVSVIAPQAPPKAGREPLHLALVLDRSGSMGGPKIALTRKDRRILDYAGDDDELKAIAEELRAEAAEFGRMMDARSMKQRYFESYSISKNRMPDGKARR